MAGKLPAAVPPSWWEYLGSASDMVVAVAALVGTIFGLIQLRRIAQANRNQVDIARAELLLEVDARFEAPEMRTSRLAIRSLRNACDNRARNERAGASDLEIATRSDILMSAELTALHQRVRATDGNLNPAVSTLGADDHAEGERYLSFMSFPYWAETVGLLTRANLLSLDDVLNLYDAVFIKFLTGFFQHIEDRRSHGPVRNDSFLENALWLREQAIKRQKDEQRIQRARRAPRRGGLGS